MRESSSYYEISAKTQLHGAAPPLYGLEDHPGTADDVVYIAQLHFSRRTRRCRRHHLTFAHTGSPRLSPTQLTRPVSPALPPVVLVCKSGIVRARKREGREPDGEEKEAQAQGGGTTSKGARHTQAQAPAGGSSCLLLLTFPSRRHRSGDNGFLQQQQQCPQRSPGAPAAG